MTMKHFLLAENNFCQYMQVKNLFSTSNSYPSAEVHTATVLFFTVGRPGGRE
jgi:hypothetical protein